VEGSCFPKTALEKVNRWRAGGVGDSWRRPPPVDNRAVGHTVLDREYHALNLSGFGVTPSGVEGSCFPETALEKVNG